MLMFPAMDLTNNCLNSFSVVSDILMVNTKKIVCTSASAGFSYRIAHKGKRGTKETDVVL